MSPYFGWLKHLSFFNYAMEALLVNEMLYLQLVEERYGLNIDVSIARAKWKKIERCIKWIVFVTIKIGTWRHHSLHIRIQCKKLLARCNQIGSYVYDIYYFCTAVVDYLCQGTEIEHMHASRT